MASVGTMWGSSSEAAICASRRKRSRKRSPSASSGISTLSATCRAVGVLGEVDGARRAAPDQPHDPIAGDDASGREDVGH